ncbi:carbohydrate ABC transporter permease [Bacillus sp. FJAT-26390]|uniref:carbohydrate ABC transporter permease n=1 Tax=Bacillus sp. FJAT-26390 TaxID=1743142 RepID=UPI000807B8D5|nr:sugar ABC transporter permease [Bacillus sp. FJAT-26390]OBZ17663.1 ABC transporter permease [Bacillus sp. FJAT-26390]
MNLPKIGLTLHQKQKYKGIWFIIPWFIGFLLLFLVPLINSLRYSFNTLNVDETGFSMQFAGWSNYKNVLFVNEHFVRTLTESLLNMVINVPLIVIFSLFAAVLLNQRFKGRALARAIFFLPVILASGVIASIESGDYMQGVINNASQQSSGEFAMFQNLELAKLILNSGVDYRIVEYLVSAVNRIYQIVTSSGVQILIFVAGLQSISGSLYEASKIEGATAYESFWKITFPMISPLILTNVIYSIIDNLLSSPTTSLIRDTAFKSFQFGYSASMAWIYFAVISVFLWIVVMLISKKVFYYN